MALYLDIWNDINRTVFAEKKSGSNKDTWALEQKGYEKIKVIFSRAHDKKSFINTFFFISSQTKCDEKTYEILAK